MRGTKTNLKKKFKTGGRNTLLGGDFWRLTLGKKRMSIYSFFICFSCILSSCSSISIRNGIWHYSCFCFIMIVLDMKNYLRSTHSQLINKFKSFFEGFHVSKVCYAFWAAEAFYQLNKVADSSTNKEEVIVDINSNYYKSNNAQYKKQINEEVIVAIRILLALRNCQVVVPDIITFSFILFYYIASSMKPSMLPSWDNDSSIRMSFFSLIIIKVKVFTFPCL